MLATPTAALAIMVQLLAAPPMPEITPISARLGLADIRLQIADPPGGVASVRAEVRRGDDGPARTITLYPVLGGPAGSWSGRLFTGHHPADDLRCRIVTTSRDGVETSTAESRLSLDMPAGASTPDWAKGAVWYQIFVERFRNGNPRNDPPSPEFSPTPWNADWDAVSVDELELARARAAASPVGQSLSPRRRGGQLGNVLSARRYGGDLEGVVEKLDELKDLGITALYLNPIFEAHSHHKYDASDYRHIDPSFAGPGRTEAESLALARETHDPQTWQLTAADRYFFEVFIPAVRARGMHIVLDGVWNHVGTRHWAFADLVTRGSESVYRDWFIATFSDDRTSRDWEDQQLDLRPGRLIGWKSWGDGRNGGLPEFARDRATGRLAPAVEKHVFDATSRWTRAVDGWRLDVVPDLPVPFWRAWSDHVRTINPDAGLFSEVWFDSRDYFSAPPRDPTAPKIFDGQMNYPFAMSAVRWLAGEPAMTAPRLAAQFSRVFSHAPAHQLVQMNLLASHDTERLASMLINPGREYDQDASPAANQRYNDRRPGAEGYRRCVLAVALQTLCEGSPMIYYGDEYGMYGADDPHCRKPLPWPDLGPYPMDDHAEPGLRDEFRRWLRLRSPDHPDAAEVLRFGQMAVEAVADGDLLVIERRLNDQRVVGLLNRSPLAAPLPRNAGDLDLTQHSPTLGAVVEGAIPPLSAAVWTLPGPAVR